VRGSAGDDAPARPRKASLVQTIGWPVRPIALLEDRRRRFADAFSITILRFERPIVPISYPGAIRAPHGLPRPVGSAAISVLGRMAIHAASS
jgi:hypothetical protein